MKTSLSVLLLLLGLAEISKSVSIESQSELKNPADPAKSDSKIEPEQIQKQVAAPKIDPLVQTEQSQEEDLEFAKDISAVLEQNQSQCCKPKKCKPKQCKPKCKPKCETDSDDEIKICVIKKDPCSDDDSSHEKNDDDCCPDPKPKIWECKPKNKCCHKCNQKISIWNNHFKPFGYNQNNIFRTSGPATPCFDPACFKSCDIICNEGFRTIEASSQVNIYNNITNPYIQGDPNYNGGIWWPFNPIFPFLTNKYAPVVENLCILNQATNNSIPTISFPGASPYLPVISQGSFVSLEGAWSPDVYNPKTSSPITPSDSPITDLREWIEVRFKQRTLVTSLIMQGFQTPYISPSATFPAEFGYVASFFLFWYDGSKWFTFDNSLQILEVGPNLFTQIQPKSFNANSDNTNISTIVLPVPVYAKTVRVMINTYAGQRPFLRLAMIAVDNNQGFCK